MPPEKNDYTSPREGEVVRFERSEWGSPLFVLNTDPLLEPTNLRSLLPGTEVANNNGGRYLVARTGLVPIGEKANVLTPWEQVGRTPLTIVKLPKT